VKKKKQGAAVYRTLFPTQPSALSLPEEKGSRALPPLFAREVRIAMPRFFEASGDAIPQRGWGRGWVWEFECRGEKG